MIFNKHILEAIGKGIKLALDDYNDLEDKEQLSSKSTIIGDEESTKTLIEFKNLFVDLGLPSGTLWCKYNLGVDWRNINKNLKHTTSKDWYGDYYAWGEIKTKNWYNWGTYKYAQHYTDFSESEQLLKYCNSSSKGYHGYSDDLNTLEKIDDAAYKIDKRFKIPSKEQCLELLLYTDKKIIQNYNDIHDLNGVLFIGKNGNELFIPFGGWYEDVKLKLNGYRCYIWTSNISSYHPSVAYALYASENDINCYSSKRCDGINIRPIYNIEN